MAVKAAARIAAEDASVGPEVGATVVVAAGPDHDGVAVDGHGATEGVVPSAAVSLATWSYVVPPSQPSLERKTYLSPASSSHLAATTMVAP